MIRAKDECLLECQLEEFPDISQTRKNTSISPEVVTGMLVLVLVTFDLKQSKQTKTKETKYQTDVFLTTGHHIPCYFDH